jgi:hypothetical protein
VESWLENFHKSPEPQQDTALVWVDDHPREQ